MAAPNMPTLPVAPSISVPSQISTRMGNLATALSTVPGLVDALRVHVEALPATATLEWDSGTDYAVGASAWSPTDFITYRCIVAAGPSHGSTTDPASTPARWVNPAEPAAGDQAKLDFISISTAKNLDNALTRRTFTADGAVTAQYAVFLNSDGTVSECTVSGEADNWRAVARDGASDGETLRLWWIGDIASGFTGLTFEAPYFVDDDGAIVLSDTGRPIGYAISSTEIYITYGGTA